MKKSFVLSTVAAAFALLAGSSAAEASVVEFSVPQVQPELVTPNDTFTFDYSGYNSTSGTGYILGGGTATFGTPLTLATGGVNGQSLTLTSTETVNGLTTTDTFTLTTPTNFITTTTVNGTKITALQFDIGNANSGVIPGAPNTVDYALPVTGNTQTGGIIYNTATTFALTPTTTLTNNGLSLAAVEGVNDGTTAISTLAIHSFTYSVTYNTIPTVVPEPSTMALGALGLAGCAATILRRRRARN